jgi:hypothetical protein
LDYPLRKELALSIGWEAGRADGWPGHCIHTCPFEFETSTTYLFYGLFDDAISSLDCTVLNDSLHKLCIIAAGCLNTICLMIGRLINNELERMWKEVFVAYF